MAIAAKVLADGLCAASLTAVYTAPASTTALVKTITIRNTNGNSESVEIAINASGSDRVIWSGILASGDSLVCTDPLVLQTGDALKISATTATGVPHTVHGAEVT